MNVQNFVPIGFKLAQKLVNFEKVANKYTRYTYQQSKPIQKFIPYHFRIFFGLSLIWSRKSAPKDDEVPKVECTSVLQQADNLFENSRFEECFLLLSNNELSKVEKDVEIKWRICRALYNMSKEPKYDDKYKKDLVMQAYNIISEQLKENWEHFPTQKWFAILLDAKSSHDGIKEKIKQLNNVKKHMDLAVTINPKDATTLYMLGEWCYQIADMPWHQRRIAEVLFGTPPQSSFEDALEYFLRAEEAQPRFYSLNLLRLGCCYLKLNKDDQAKYYLRLAASYPAKSNDDHLANKEAADILTKKKW